MVVGEYVANFVLHGKECPVNGEVEPSNCAGNFFLSGSPAPVKKESQQKTVTSRAIKIPENASFTSNP
jgi:hypothetical protein